MAITLPELCFLLLSLALRLQAQSYNNQFINPSASGPPRNYEANLIFQVGTTQKISWSTSLTTYNITFWQQVLEGDSARNLATVFTANGDGAGSAKSFNWKVQTYNTDLKVSSVYFFWVNHDGPTWFTSHYFNMTDSPQSTSVSSSSSTTGSRSIESSSATSTTSVPATISANPGTFVQGATSITPSSTTSNSHQDLKIGLGVGLGVGIPAVFIAGLFLGLRLLKRQKNQEKARQPSTDPSVSHPYSHPPGPKHLFERDSTHSAPPQYVNQFHELPARALGPHEVPG